MSLSPAGGSAALAPLESPHETIPESLQIIYRRMVAPAPTDRYATADDLIQDLDAFLEGTKISSDVPKWVIATGFVAAAALLIAFLWFGAHWLRSG